MKNEAAFDPNLADQAPPIHPPVGPQPGVRKILAANPPLDLSQVHPAIKTSMDTGIPVSKAEFHASVNNSDDVPENQFSESSNSKSRQVKMWWVPGGLLCLHKNKFFMVPTSTVKYANFK
jgi:hypothetical protein